MSANTERKIEKVGDLRTHRINAGLSAEAMAAEIGISPHVYRYIERTGACPRPATAKQIADWAGWTVLELWPEKAA